VRWRPPSPTWRRPQAAGSAPRARLPAIRSPASCPPQRTVRWATPSRRAQALDRARLTGGCAPQAVVDRDRDELRPALERAAPSRHQHQQRGRIGPPETAKTRAQNARERSKQPLRLGAEDRRRLVSSGHAFVLARHPCFTAADARGNLRRTSPSDAQAASFSPSAASDCPRRRSASGALAVDSYLVETLRKASAASRKRWRWNMLSPSQ